MSCPQCGYCPTCGRSNQLYPRWLYQQPDGRQPNLVTGQTTITRDICATEVASIYDMRQHMADQHADGSACTGHTLMETK